MEYPPGFVGEGGGVVGGLVGVGGCLGGFISVAVASGGVVGDFVGDGFWEWEFEV